MTVLDQVLTAEEEAAKTTLAAEEEAATMVARARAAAREAIREAEDTLHQQKIAALNEFQAQIDQQTKEINEKAQSEVSAIERAFDTAQGEIQDAIKAVL